MDLYVVFDTKGAGRLVGVFETLSKAQSIVEVNPGYFRLHPCILNAVNPEILRWALTERERGLLFTLVSEG